MIYLLIFLVFFAVVSGLQVLFWALQLIIDLLGLGLGVSQVLGDTFYRRDKR